MSVLPANTDGARPATRRPRIGFLGTGWIGRSRMQSLAASGLVDVTAAADPSSDARTAVARNLPDTALVADLDALLSLNLDGVVIATPSALHAEQAIAALARGVAVFCQKPLARDHGETLRVIEAAHRADRLLGVDLCYRHTDAAQALRRCVQRGELGDIYAADLVFHNAYGPDKPWFTQRGLSGGGCLIDLGIHLLDLTLWLTSCRRPEIVSPRLLRCGRPVEADTDEVEDFATAELRTETGAAVRLACSWFLPAGQDCVFECTLYGTQGAVSMRNLNGSFYDFTAERFAGTRRHTLSAPGEDWGGRAIASWAQRLAAESRFDADAAAGLTVLAKLIDAIYEGAR